MGSIHLIFQQEHFVFVLNFRNISMRGADSPPQRRDGWRCHAQVLGEGAQPQVAVDCSIEGRKVFFTSPFNHIAGSMVGLTEGQQGSKLLWSH